MAKKVVNIGVEGVFTAREIMRSAFHKIECKFDQSFGNAADIVPAGSGSDDIESLLLGNGYPKGGLTILAGAPSVGKTAFALDFVGKTVVNNKTPSLIFAPSANRENLLLQMMSQGGKVDYSRLRAGRLGESDWPKLTHEAGILSDSPLWIDDTSAIQIDVLCQRATEMKNRHKIELVLVDYLQLLETQRLESRYAELNLISRRLKGLARDLDVAVVAISTINRARLLRNPKNGQRPILSDLRDCGSLEDDADLILFLHRGAQGCEYCAQGDFVCDNHSHWYAELIIAKQSSGPVGTVYYTFRKNFLTFEPKKPAKESETETP